MNNNLYEDLKRIGINEDLAHRVDKALAPEHVATKQDLLVMHDCMDAGARAMQEQLPQRLFYKHN